MKHALIAAVAALSLSAMAAPAFAQNESWGRDRGNSQWNDSGRPNRGERGDGERNARQREGDDAARNDNANGQRHGERQRSDNPGAGLAGGPDAAGERRRAGEYRRNDPPNPQRRATRTRNGNGAAAIAAMMAQETTARATSIVSAIGQTTTGHAMMTSQMADGRTADRDWSNNNGPGANGGGRDWSNNNGPRRENDGRDRGHDDRRYGDNNRDNQRWDNDRRDNRRRDYNEGRRYAYGGHDYRGPRYDDWRRVRPGRYFNDYYARSARSYYGHAYYWWDYPSWQRPYRPYRVGFALPAFVYWDDLPYDFYGYLPPPPYGCRYVAVDRDVLLIVISSGLILDALLYDGDWRGRY